MELKRDNFARLFHLDANAIDKRRNTASIVIGGGFDIDFDHRGSIRSDSDAMAHDTAGL